MDDERRDAGFWDVMMEVVSTPVRVAESGHEHLSEIVRSGHDTVGELGAEAGQSQRKLVDNLPDITRAASEAPKAAVLGVTASSIALYAGLTIVGVAAVDAAFNGGRGLRSITG